MVKKYKRRKKIYKINPKQLRKWQQEHMYQSDQISCSVMSDSLWPHESQHARPPCPYFKCKWIKCSNQNTQTEWIQKKKKQQKTHIYALYKKPTSDLKTHIDWKWEDGKICSMHKPMNFCVAKAIRKLASSKVCLGSQARLRNQGRNLTSCCCLPLALYILNGGTRAWK